ncbi:hypothetical protein CGCS363_v011777 [Colletotrichum siamense]|uniref:uncharacterized protein n=1 Tax=Colletotrichum siamense TaxID=690259 RepID=UPI001872ABD6|nr:uncharacterized protein CGCS363_v011777 [Colletotrichum siamense]KAF5489901.1 hypothetical protein CGCS363_v011777 [Colletotrichum siamense]
MFCDVCKEGIEEIWDPSRTKRVGKFKELEAQWGSSKEPRDGFAKYWSSLPEDRDNFAELDPSECLFIHHKTAASFMASVHDGCAMCNYFYRWGNIDIPSSLQEEEENSGCCFSVFSMDIDWEYHFLSIQILAKTDRRTGSTIKVVDIKADRNINFEYEASTNSATRLSDILSTYSSIANE